ncbi:MAG TPA: purine-nucleoside phosphorylase [Candidatus Coprenecus stercorigallinarum]|nr:purine-nucleoside phosphorylase [Candidatus Coprenecus stercorigallinarum]
MDARMNAITEATGYMQTRLGGRRPQVGIILGSGLGKLADRIEDQLVIPYTEVPGFVRSTAMGHKGNFISGTLGGKQVLAMQGRFHYYEGYTMDKVTLPVRVMVRLGISALFVSNAAGGVNFGFKVGDLMIIQDHINKLPNPLIGPNLDEFGPRFPDMTRPYDPKLIAMAEEIGREKGIVLKKGVYLAGTGPSYETPSEYKYFRMIGADAIGMSTIPEVIVARHSSVPVFGMSVITNEAHDDYAEDFENNGDDVVRAADAAADRMTAIFTALIERL